MIFTHGLSMTGTGMALIPNHLMQTLLLRPHLVCFVVMTELLIKEKSLISLLAQSDVSFLFYVIDNTQAINRLSHIGKASD
jgi:hypothetical protein